MHKKDMFLLLEAENDLNKLDELLQMLTGVGYSEGTLTKLDNVCTVIQRNSIPRYQNSDDDFFKVLLNRKLSIEDKYKLLLGESHHE